MSETYKVRLVASIGEIDPAQWDACANPDAASDGETADTVLGKILNGVTKQVSAA